MKDNDVKKNYPVVKKNILNSAVMKISLIEYRIILLAMSKINPEFNNYKDIEFTVQEFYSIFKEDDKFFKGSYNIIRRTCKKLLSRVVEIKNEKDITLIQWFSKARLPNNSNKIFLSFHEEIAPFICYLINNKNYTSYLLANVSKIKSIYAIRIYELLKEDEYKKKRIFKVSELRQILGLPDNKYKLYADFKRRIIEFAREELINKCDIYFTYKEFKSHSRKIEEIEFIIIKNNKNIPDEFKKYTKFELIHKLNNSLAEKLNIRLHTSNLSDYHRLILIDLIKFMQDGSFGNIKHPYSFIEKEIDEIEKRYDKEQMKKIEDY